MSGMQTARFTRLGLGLHSSLHCTAWPGSSFAPNYALPVWLRLVVYVLCNGIVGLTMSVGGCQAPERRRIAVSAPSYQVIDTLPAWNLPGRTLPCFRNPISSMRDPHLSAPGLYTWPADGQPDVAQMRHNRARSRLLSFPVQAASRDQRCCALWTECGRCALCSTLHGTILFKMPRLAPAAHQTRGSDRLHSSRPHCGRRQDSLPAAIKDP